MLVGDFVDQNVIHESAMRIEQRRVLRLAELELGRVIHGDVLHQIQRLRAGFNGRLEGAQTAMITARIAVASALLAGVSWVVWRLLDGILGVSLPAQIVSVTGAAAAGLFVYARAVLAMRIPEAHQVSRLVRGRLGPA